MSPRPAPTRRRLAAALLGAALLLPAGLVAPAAVSGTGQGFRLDLVGRGDFVGQVDPNWCIGASMQMMLNIVGVTDDRSAATQAQLMDLARSHGMNAAWVGRPGASPQSLAWGLRSLGAGSYTVTSAATLQEAAQVLARAIRLTGRPAAISVHRGTHSWVVAGFTATADPRTAASFEVTGLIVLDPWYPRTYRGWPRSVAPGTLLTLDQLAKHYTPWDRPGRASRWSGRYRFTMPVIPAPLHERAARAV